VQYKTLRLKRPTEEAYKELQDAYDFYCDQLFDNALPSCMITFQREKKTMGYFAPRRFVNREGSITDEIALNPEYFAVIPMVEILQTLVHEMAHQWQFHLGQHKSRSGYHNAEWAAKMEAIGLMPSDTGGPGGKKTGQSMGDYIIGGGRFDQVTRNILLPAGFAISWFDRHHVLLPQPAAVLETAAVVLATTSSAPGSQPELFATAAEEQMYQPPATLHGNLSLVTPSGENRSNRTKYVCPECKLALWGKPNARVGCLDCNLAMPADVGIPPVLPPSTTEDLQCSNQHQSPGLCLDSSPVGGQSPSSSDRGTSCSCRGSA